MWPHEKNLLGCKPPPKGWSIPSIGPNTPMSSEAIARLPPIEREPCSKYSPTAKRSTLFLAWWLLDFPPIFAGRTDQEVWLELMSHPSQAETPGRFSSLVRRGLSLMSPVRRGPLKRGVKDGVVRTIMALIFPCFCKSTRPTICQIHLCLSDRGFLCPSPSALGWSGYIRERG